MVEEALTDTPVVAINGARQVGKSTLARSFATDRGATLVSLDDEVARRAAGDDPRGFVERDSSVVPLIIDEVQLETRLFRAVKAALDRDRQPGRFLLTGSTRLLSTPDFADAFVGRIEIVELWPLSQGEIDDAPDGFIDWAFQSKRGPIDLVGLDRRHYGSILTRGGFPEVVLREPRRRGRWFESYLVTLTEKVIQQVSAIERSAEIPRIIRFCAARSGDELNISKLASDLALPRRTLDGYLALLSNVFVLQLIPAWSTNISRKVIRRPKITMVDSGLAAHLVGLTPSRLEDPTSRIGPLLQSFVAMELRKQLTWCSNRASLWHFRDGDGAEVDLVLEHADGRVIGIETKFAKSVSSRDIAGLRFLAERLGDRFHGGFVLSAMPEIVPLGNRITALPIEALWRAAPA